MIEYYHIPTKTKQISSSETLTISQEYQLKDAIHNKSILKMKSLNMRNSNINDGTLSLLCTIAEPLNLIILNLSENFSFVTDESLFHICQCEGLRNLKELHLADNSVSDQGILKLSKCPNMIKLQELTLYGNSDITSAALVHLAQSDYITNLKKLDLHDTSVCDKGACAFLASANSQNLTHLDLSMNSKKITDLTLKALAFSHHCKSLISLRVEDCFITDSGLEYLMDSDNASNLQHLNCNNSINKKNNLIGDFSLQALAFSKSMRKLKSLELRNTDVTSKGINSLSVSINVENLQILRLSHCMGIKDDSLRYFECIADYRSLLKLYVNSTMISKEVGEKIGQKYPNLTVIY